MNRYWRIYRIFFISSFQRELEFRANFIAKNIQNCVWVVFFTLIIAVIFQNTKEIAGWNQGEVLVVVATCMILSSLHSAMFMSLMEIPEQVRKGSLDFVVTKPVNSLFWVSFRRFDLGKIGAMIVGFLVLGYGLWQSGAPVTPVGLLAYAWASVCGLALLYALSLFLMTLAIYFTRVDNLWVLGDTLVDVARFPVDIYPSFFRSLLVYAVPLGLLATIPSAILVKGLGLEWLLLTTVWAVMANLGAWFFWNRSLVRYSSASS